MDMEKKVVKGLECCFSHVVPCGDCPYFSCEDCERNLLHDALALLRDTGSVGIRQTVDSIEFTAFGDAQHGYELGIVIGKMAMLDYVWKSCLNRNVMTDDVLNILKMARRKI